jgi:hypothetical protein
LLEIRTRLAATLLQRRGNRQRVATTQLLVREARKPMEARLCEKVIDDELRQVSRRARGE